jgi:hypothetical protein
MSLYMGCLSTCDMYMMYITDSACLAVTYSSRLALSARHVGW